MFNDEAYQILVNKGCSHDGALRLLTYAYQAQYVGSWASLFVNDVFSHGGGSEGAKGIAMEVFKDAGIDPMTITFPERVSLDKISFSSN